MIDEERIITIAGPSGQLHGGAAHCGGLKNVAMPAIVAAALSNGAATVTNVPNIADIRVLLKILISLKMDVSYDGSVFTSSNSHPVVTTIPDGLSRRLRGSIYALAVPVVLCGQGKIGAVGGDIIKGRSLEAHLRAFTGFGMDVSREAGQLCVRNGPPRPSEFWLNERLAGVSASCLTVLLASSVEGRSIVRGVSAEIEVQDMIEVVNAFGAQAHLEGGVLTVQGPMSPSDSPQVYALPEDHIAHGTLVLAVAATDGSITLETPVANRLTTLLRHLADSGVNVTENGSDIQIAGAPRRPIRVETGGYPLFPSDLLPPLTAFLLRLPGTSRVVERVYDYRFSAIPQLRKMGAKIHVDGNTAYITGGRPLDAGTMIGCGIRETAGLLIAALIADGQSVIRAANALWRGYVDLPGLLKAINAPVNSITIK